MWCYREQPTWYILDHHMLVVAVLDNTALQVIHYTGEKEEKVRITVQNDPPPAEEDSMWNRFLVALMILLRMKVVLIIHHLLKIA